MYSPGPAIVCEGEDAPDVPFEPFTQQTMGQPLEREMGSPFRKNVHWLPNVHRGTAKTGAWGKNLPTS